MRPSFDNTVIVIGGDHHNTLAVVRCLGRKKCNQKILVITEKTDPEQLCIAKSKYAKHKVDCVAESEKGILQWLVEHATEQKQILFPCSDLAAYVIDAHYQELAANYILPGFKDAPGRVVELMDKWRQYMFAKEHHLLMARTWKLQKQDGFCIPQDMLYPCIVKPIVSAFGKKSDITICHSKEELQSALRCLTDLEYDTLLVQQFLQKQYEACALGCLVDNKDNCAGGIIRKVREYPPGGGGSATYAYFTEDTSVKELQDKVLQYLYHEGYRGQYDMDIFVCDDGVYLNEINFRHSGNGFALCQNGVAAPFIWCASSVSAKQAGKFATRVKKGKYLMDELQDIRHVKEGKISLLSWMKDAVRVSAFSRFDTFDMGGAAAYYRPRLKALAKKLGKISR